MIQWTGVQNATTATRLLRGKRLQRGSVFVLVQEDDDDLDAAIREEFGAEEHHQRRASLRIVGDHADGELDLFLDEHGWGDEWDQAIHDVVVALQLRNKTREGMQLASTATRPATHALTPSSARVASDYKHGRAKTGLPAPSRLPTSARRAAERATDKVGPPSPPSLPPPLLRTRAKTERRAAVARPEPRTAAERARMLDNESDNPFAKSRALRHKVQNWRRSSAQVASSVVIDHQEFAALLAAKRNLMDEALPSSRGGSSSAASPHATPALPVRGGVRIGALDLELEDSPRAKARPLVSARLYAAAAAGGQRSASKWPELVARAGCLEDKLSLLGNLVQLDAQRGVSVAFSGARSYGGGQGAGQGAHLDRGSVRVGDNGGAGGSVDGGGCRRAQVVLPRGPLARVEDGGEPALARPPPGRARRGGLPPPHALMGLADGGGSGPSPPKQLAPLPRAGGAGSISDAASTSSPLGLAAGGPPPAVGASTAPSFIAMMKAASLLRKKARAAAEAVAARREVLQAVKRREVLKLYDAYLEEEKGKPLAGRGAPPAQLSRQLTRPGLGRATRSDVARGIDTKVINTLSRCLFWSSGHSPAPGAPVRFFRPALSSCGVSCML